MTNDRKRIVPAQDPALRTVEPVNRTPSPTAAGARSKPLPGELPDAALDGVAGGARITKTDLLKLM